MYLPEDNPAENLVSHKNKVKTVHNRENHLIPVVVQVSSAFFLLNT